MSRAAHLACLGTERGFCPFCVPCSPTSSGLRQPVGTYGGERWESVTDNLTVSDSECQKPLVKTPLEGEESKSPKKEVTVQAGIVTRTKDPASWASSSSL